MLTDGMHNGRGNPLDAAQKLKNAGVIIDCIGIAGSRNEVDEDLLRHIASFDNNGVPRYCFIDDTINLITKFQSLSCHIKAV